MQNIVTNGIRVDVMYVLHNISKESKYWELQVDYAPMFESKMLREFFYDVGKPRLKLTDYGHLEPGIAVLVEEIRQWIPAPPIFKEAGLKFEPVGELSHIRRTPLGTWGGERPDYSASVIMWSRPYKIAGRDVWEKTKDIVQVSSLSSAAQATIKQLDGLAIERAHRLFQTALEEATQIPESSKLPPRKAKVFISYSHTHKYTAEKLHELFASYHSLFLPYLDRHDLRLGDWKEQFFKAIRESDVFIPIVTAEYAAPGRFSLEEYELAKRLGQEQGREDLIAPVFVEPGCSVEMEVRKLQGLELHSGEFQASEPRVSDFLRQVLASAFSPR